MNAFSIRGFAGVGAVPGDGLADVFVAVAQSMRASARTPKAINQTANPILYSREVFIYFPFPRTGSSVACQSRGPLDQVHDAAEEFRRRGAVHHAMIHGQTKLQRGAYD